METKRVIRYFAGMMTAQERWLNKMSAEGWRLVKTGKLTYDFERCGQGEYEYKVEFSAYLPWEKQKDYMSFLEETGYRVMTKNINISLSVGKVRWRPYGQGAGQIATAPGGINKELIIIEKKADGKPFELRTSNADKAAYFSRLRSANLTGAAGFIAFGIWGAMSGQLAVGVIFGMLGIIFAVFAAIQHRTVLKYKQEGKISE